MDNNSIADALLNWHAPQASRISTQAATVRVLTGDEPFALHEAAFHQTITVKEFMIHVAYSLCRVAHDQYTSGFQTQSSIRNSLINSAAEYQRFLDEDLGAITPEIAAYFRGHLAGEIQSVKFNNSPDVVNQVRPKCAGAAQRFLDRLPADPQPVASEVRPSLAISETDLARLKDGVHQLFNLSYWLLHGYRLICPIFLGLRFPFRSSTSAR